MPLLKVGVCPVCDRIFKFEITEDLVSLVRKCKHTGIITYRLIEKLIPPNKLMLHYFILDQKIVLLIKEQNSDHHIYLNILCNGIRPFEPQDIFGIMDKKFTEYFIKNLNLDIHSDDLPLLMGTLNINEFLNKTIKARA